MWHANTLARLGVVCALVLFHLLILICACGYEYFCSLSVRQITKKDLIDSY